MNKPEENEDILHHFQDQVDHHSGFLSLLHHQQIFDRKIQRILPNKLSFNTNKIHFNRKMIDHLPSMVV